MRYDASMAEVLLLVSMVIVASGAQPGSKPVACPEGYASKAAQCEKVACDKRYESLIGSWNGPFESYDKSMKDFRPYQNQVSYSDNDCLKNVDSGDVFIVGRKTDVFPVFKGLPGKTVQGIMMTGMRAGDPGRPFLTSVEEGAQVTYDLVFKDSAAELSVWKYVEPAKGLTPEMTFTVIDGLDLLERGTHRRVVTVTLQVGPAASPYWRGVVAKGSQVRVPPTKPKD